MKSALKRSVGLLTLSRTELETVLHEIEACLNSRPLTFVGDDPAYSAPLTPAHFLIGRCPFTPATTGDLLVTCDDLVQHNQVRKWMLDKFWEVWSQKYIRSLPPGGSGRVKGDIQIGSVVMVREDNTPRLLWPMGVVTKVHPGRDGIVRTVSVRTSRGTFVRPIQQIHDLEVMDHAPQSSIVGPAETSSPQDSVSESVNVEEILVLLILTNLTNQAFRSGLSRLHVRGVAVSSSLRSALSCNCDLETYCCVVISRNGRWIKMSWLDPVYWYCVMDAGLWCHGS